MEDTAENRTIYGLIGRGISYSFSSSYFNNFFEKNGLNGHYQNFDISTIEEVKKVFDTPQLKGCNVTIPYKTEVIPYLDQQDEESKAIGAVNCISFKQGRLTGHNTDAYGFTKSLKDQLKKGDHVALVLGATGGAAKAIIYALNALNIKVITVSRGGNSDFTYESLDHVTVRHTPLIINCTPLGTYPKIDQAPPIPYEVLNASHFLFDLVYNPEVSTFLRRGKNAGARIENGYNMLVYQAQRSWEIWNSL
ncbi:MAG: shikimate dehydrogenase family protein [Flavobacteriaceae bacterium]